MAGDNRDCAESLTLLLKLKRYAALLPTEGQSSLLEAFDTGQKKISGADYCESEAH